MSGPVAPRSRYVKAGRYSLHLTEWGEPGQPAIVMWHGLARTGRDFDAVAAHFARRGHHVICPDALGRGLSDWAADPASDYTIAAYVGHALALLDQLRLGAVCWLGTSMGGRLGMTLAGGAGRDRIARLALNDSGPQMNPDAVRRIAAYATARPAFDSLPELEQYLRGIYAPFGQLSDAQWRHLAETSYRRQDDGRITVHYDPKVMEQIATPVSARERSLWEVWDDIACPVLVLHGAQSDLLLPEVVVEMGRRGPRAQAVEIQGCGHAPALNTPEQWAPLEAFFT